MHTDGACRGNPGPGGWGALIEYSNHRKELWGGETLTTNNRMELQAVISGLAALNQRCDIDLYSDSKYVLTGITEWLAQWKKRDWRTAGRKPVKNVDLWQQLDAEVARHQIRWHWVKGHSGDAGNEMADALANRAIDELLVL
jgi:ribonuclease HI